MVDRHDEHGTQQLLDALNSAVRRDILWLVWEEDRTAGDIARACGLSAATISEHLAVLREAGLISMQKDRTFRRYRAQQHMVRGLRGLLESDTHKWFPGSTPAPLALARTVGVAVVTVDATCDQATAFRAFTDAVVYTRWLGVPVSLHEGNFACTMEWGLEVRGVYEHVLPPALIVMRWDFEAGVVPVPGDTRHAYLHFTPRTDGVQLTLHQLVRSPEEAAYMERAWGLVLGRFRDHVHEALDTTQPTQVRARRSRSTPRDDA
ncbi:MAG: metalloregulator ArsR/SmtB family transcription factor [Gemmatimonadaceae bacterium]|nr:metalloregulator ArsR/SmtB family transcription factor [Gemmatimonadaceae bacterium]